MTGTRGFSGETFKTAAVCLAVRPWSRTSHIVTWLTPAGRLVTSVKGAVRAKSFFLGQYDANYTCALVCYARAHGEVHALRECVPVARRDALRDDWRALVVAERGRWLAGRLAPSGPEAAGWYRLLSGWLDRLAQGCGRPRTAAERLAELLDYELSVLDLAGLRPCTEEAGGGLLALRGTREMRVSASVAACLRRPLAARDLKVLVDTARVVGVLYMVHLDCRPERRRTVLRLLCQ